jgi:hypothetical protein
VNTVLTCLFLAAVAAGVTALVAAWHGWGHRTRLTTTP